MFIVLSKTSNRENIDNIFCWQEDRTLSNNLTLQYNKVLFLIQDSPQTRKLAGKRVTVHDYHEGRIKIFMEVKSYITGFSISFNLKPYLFICVVFKLNLIAFFYQFFIKKWCVSRTHNHIKWFIL